MSNITIANHTIRRAADLADVPTKVLLAFYNERTDKKTRKFASRAKGEAQVWKLVQAQQVVNERAEAPTGKARGFNYAPAKEVRAHRTGTKRARAVALLDRKRGATVEEVMADIGWSRKDAYDGIRLLHSYLGFGLATDEAGRVRLVRPAQA